MRAMTGYATVTKSDAGHTAQVILRSSNFKYLDINVRNLLAEDIILEEAIKREIKRRIFRGKIEVFVLWEEPQAKRVIIDEKVVARYIHQARALAKKYKVRADIGISGVLNLPQAISWEQKRRGNYGFVIGVLREALEQLMVFKKKEGRAIQKEMLYNIAKLKANVARIKKAKPAIGQKDNGKEDIDEELSLITFYIKKLEATMRSLRQRAKGKSIDFLTQEILRELNAASSKTKQKTAALLVVEAKNYLERIREQTQNIE